MLLFAFYCSQPALADAHGNDRSGWAFNAGIGASIIRDEDGTETFRGTAFAYDFGFEYRTTGPIAFGMTIFDMGTATDTVSGVSTDIKVRGFDLYGRYIFTKPGDVEVYGLLGAAIYDADVSTGGGFSLFGEGAWEVGGGIDFVTSENVSVRIEARFLNGERDESGGLMTVGLNYRF